ncbi:hypothetical protein DFR55_11448 [Herbinix hemicellulosilytica]|jgi:hypothetical protein|uniref:Uncharacterized protein n=1 Tax=Herbinix hemicellulosilytica TaxID=1564487 RepID=A0A0H5SL31_HERHM|nr:hypothetical protein [Herbinix hemicellulosilytica]RBP58166.1 hypothetical protein DFR55_11448 [Herbinix hemicellulosilytica]CRZ35830.1 hypothetical protein HHT355_2649 [Herbinix hemicellulosilytica]
MNKVLIECDTLIDEYELSRENIIKQLETIKIEKDQDFVIAYDKDFRFTLVGEMSKNNNSIVLTNIIKADDFREMDNSDLFQFIREQGD